MELQITWRGHEVGKLQDPSPDMWYLEGIWQSNGSPQAKEFESLVKSFDIKQVTKDPSLGTRITFNGAEGINHALVIKLVDNTLILRRVIEKQAVEWLTNNVE